MPRVLRMPMPAAAAAAVAHEPVQLGLFHAEMVDIAALRAERAAIAEASRAPATARAYAADWRVFTGWCAAAGRCALPASADTVSLFLVAEASARAMATVTRRASAIGDRHLRAGYGSPLDDTVSEVLSGLRRRHGTAPRAAKAAAGVEELRLMLNTIDGTARRGAYSWALPGGEIRAVRDRAVLLLGFAGAFRRSELAGLDLADVHEAVKGLRVLVRRSKTDQEGEGQVVGVHRGRGVMCPVRAVAAWVAVRGGWPGPLFARVGSKGVERRRLGGRAVADVVKLAARRAGLDPGRYAGHSLRAGMATAAAAAGADGLAIAGRTRHGSLEMVRRYIRHGTVFAVDPLAGLLS